MATNTGKKARRAANDRPELSVDHFKEVKPLNWIQEEYLRAINQNQVIFGIGSAGTGKTFVSASYAAAELFYKRIDKIILSRPNVEVGRGLGFIPGELDEKYAPYLEPFDSVFNRTLGNGFYKYCLDNDKIVPKPLGFMRGATFDNCIVLVDEAQNITVSEMKMMLSRIGRNTKMILSGDPDQSDIKDSGLEHAVKTLEGKVEGVEVVRFQDSDIVRSKICKQIIMAYKGKL